MVAHIHTHTHTHVSLISFCYLFHLHRSRSPLYKPHASLSPYVKSTSTWRSEAFFQAIRTKGGKQGEGSVGSISVTDWRPQAIQSAPLPARLKNSLPESPRGQLVFFRSIALRTVQVIQGNTTLKGHVNMCYKVFRL